VLVSIPKAGLFTCLVKFTAGATLMPIPNPEKKEKILEENDPA
jgi:hypothetical protein